jgi:hypothetical protein
MRRSRRPSAALALIAMVVLLCACGSTAPAGTGRASSGAGHAPADTGSRGGTTTAAKREQAVKFAKCMRSSGVSQFPDPDASGRLTIDAVANGSSLDTSAPAFRQAISACKNLEPAGFTGSTRSPQQMQGALKFAQCIRSNGVTDFPDPLNGQPLVDTNRIPSSATSSGMSLLHAAMRRCSDVAAAAGVTR